MFAWLSNLFRRRPALPAAVEHLAIAEAQPDESKVPVVVEKPGGVAKVIEAHSEPTEAAAQSIETKPVEVSEASTTVEAGLSKRPEAPLQTSETVPEIPALEKNQLAAVEAVLVERPELTAIPLPEAPPVLLEEPPPEAPPQTTAAVIIAETPLHLDPGYQRQRSSYFAPARYGPAVSGSVRLLAPDLAYRAQQAMRPAAPRIAPPDIPEPSASPAIRARKEKLPLARFIAAPDPPLPARPGAVASLDPALFSTFILHREQAAEVPPEATDSYLARPALAAAGRKLRDLVLGNWKDGGPPLTTGAYFALASSVIDHSGTAMLLCHNVAKTFARGGVSVEWQNRNRARGEYWDGSREYFAAAVHRQGLARANALSPTSLFYLLFAARSLGVADPGDWYRYFSYATLAAYSVDSATYSKTSWENNAWTNRLEEIAGVLAGSTTEDSVAYRAWLWANTVHFAEWSAWGRRQTRALDTARMAIDAVRFAFARARVAESADWRWFVPAVRSLVAGNAGADSISQVLRASEVEPR